MTQDKQDSTIGPDGDVVRTGRGPGVSGSDDVEGHMPFKRGLTEDPGLVPDGSVRHPEPPPATGEADAEGHGARASHATEDAGVAPEGLARGRGGFTEGDLCPDCGQMHTPGGPDSAACSKH